MNKRERPMRAGAVHLLYQALIWSVVFALLSLYWGDCTRTAIFVFFAAAQLYTAVRMDNDYDSEELILVKSMLPELDTAAKSVGFAKTSDE